MILTTSAGLHLVSLFDYVLYIVLSLLLDATDTETGKSYISYINTAWLFAYAISMFIRLVRSSFPVSVLCSFFSGIVAERIDLRIFLTLGMIGLWNCA